MRPYNGTGECGGPLFEETILDGRGGPCTGELLIKCIVEGSEANENKFQLPRRQSKQRHKKDFHVSMS